MPDITYDLLIIGGGQASVPLAEALTGEGRRVALAESKHLGGSCVNFGCTPTKAAITSARYAHQARRASDFGVMVGEVKVDFAAVIARARKISSESRKELANVVKDMKGLDLIDGVAKLAGREGDAFVVEVGDRTFHAKEVLLNTGTRSIIPPIEGLNEVDFITAETWLDLTTLPDHLIIVGGGYIGLEMGQFYLRMGSKVTVVDSSTQVASHEDEDVSDEIQKILAAEGITFRLDTKLERVGKKADGIVVTVKDDNGTSEIVGSHIFVATGRKPNTDRLGLDTVGVKTDDKGIVEVDKTLATNVKGIWAAGDIRGGPMFTHTSWDDNRILVSQMIGDKKRTTDRVVPYAMFIDPQLGRVGMTEKEACEKHSNVKVAKYPMSDSGKGIELDEQDGFLKVVVDGTTDRILGAALLMPEGAELVHVYIDLMNADAPYTVVRDAIHIHPTLGEDVQSVMNNFE